MQLSKKKSIRVQLGGADAVCVGARGQEATGYMQYKDVEQEVPRTYFLLLIFLS